MSEFYIGNVKIDGNLALGPMAGVTDMPFRMICKEFGADLLYTEMISAKGIYYKNKNTAIAYKLGKIMIYDKPKNLDDIGINYVPQSFVYLD